MLLLLFNVIIIGMSVMIVVSVIIVIIAIRFGIIIGIRVIVIMIYYCCDGVYKYYFHWC